MYIVAFNGPPESGKDTLAEMLASHMDAAGVSLPVRMESLSLPLRAIAYAMVGREWMHGVHDRINYYDEFKREVFPTLGNRTGRQLLIDASESFLKPTYGETVMADLLLARNQGFPGILLVRDSGFQIEVDPLIQAVGSDNLYLVGVMREGKTLKGDSREWVFHSDPNRQYIASNNGTLNDLREEASRIYRILLNHCGWRL